MAKRVVGIYFLIAIVSAGFLLCGINAIAQADPAQIQKPAMSLERVVDTLIQQNKKRAEALESYQSRRTYTLFYKGFPDDLHAALVVDMTYIAPDTKNFQVVSQSGPKWLVDQILMRLVKTEKGAQQEKLRKEVDLNTENYTFSNLEVQPAADHCSYVLHVAPKTPNKLLYRGRIWVNDQDFAVCRIEATPSKNPSFWTTSTTISQMYQKIGNFWLPEKNTSVSTIRIGGRATLTIQYQDYRILKAHALGN